LLAGCHHYIAYVSIESYLYFFLTFLDVALASARAIMLVEWYYRKQFHCKRGVKQGDHVSPLLHVLGGDLLQYAVNVMLAAGDIKLLIITVDPNFPIIQHADDTLLIM
jgi:hypothetical protein